MTIINELGILEAAKKREEERNQTQKAYKDNLRQMLDNCLKHIEQSKNILGTCDFMSEHGLSGNVPFITLGDNFHNYITCKTDKLNHHHYTNIKLQREYDGVIASTDLTVLFNPFEKSLTIECCALTNDCIKPSRTRTTLRSSVFPPFPPLRRCKLVYLLFGLSLNGLFENSFLEDKVKRMYKQSYQERLRRFQRRSE